MPMACQIIHVHRSYCHQLQLPAPVLAPVPAPAPAPAPPPKEKCKTCSEYKCKACKNAEEMNKVVVTKTSFWNPRQHSKGIVRE